MKEAAWAIYSNVCVFFAPVFLSEPIKLVFHLASLAADSIDLFQFLGLFLFKWWFYLYIFKGKRMHAWKQHSIRHIHSALVDCRSVNLLIISMRSKYCAVIGCIGAERIEHDDQVQWADFFFTSSNTPCHTVRVWWSILILKRSHAFSIYSKVFKISSCRFIFKFSLFERCIGQASSQFEM